MLADVFHLLSLFFLTIGKGREAPATYSQIASIRVRLSAPPRLLCFLFPKLFTLFCWLRPFTLDI